MLYLEAPIRATAEDGGKYLYASPPISYITRIPHSGTGSIVVCELHKQKKFRPVVLLIAAVYAEVLFQCLVGAFSLSITFWVISRGEM